MTYRCSVGCDIIRKKDCNDIDNSDFLVKLAEVTLSHLPPPRKRKKKDGNSNPGKTR